MRILSISHVVRNPSGGASGATLELNAAMREEGHYVQDYFINDLLPRTRVGRASQETIALAATRLIVGTGSDFDVIEITGHAGWLSFPAMRFFRGHRPNHGPLLVNRSYGLEHFDHRVRLEEHSSGRAKISIPYRIGGGFITLREVELSVAACDLFVCPRPRDANWVIAHRLKSREHTWASGWGVDSAFFLSRRHDVILGRLAWIGTMVERKGWLDFVVAYTKAFRENRSLSVSVFGTGEESPVVLSHFPNDVRGSITVFSTLGQADFIEELSRCQVFVSMSLSEGFHLAVLQAMAIGLPVLATREGFLADLEKGSDHNNIYIELPKRQPNAAAAAIMREVGLSSRTFSGERASRAQQFARERSWRMLASTTTRRMLEEIEGRKALRATMQ